MNLKQAYDFYQGVRLSEVAKTLNVSEAFVSQVLSGNNASRKSLQDQWIVARNDHICIRAS